MKREKQGIHGVECTQERSLLFPRHRLMDIGWSINRTVRVELWAGSIFDPSHQLGKVSRSWSWRTRTTRVHDDACRLLPIEERCTHIEDLKKTCIFNKSIINVNHLSMCITAAGLLSSLMLRPAEPDLGIALSSILDGGMLVSTL